jgi:hypothetical protein
VEADLSEGGRREDIERTIDLAAGGAILGTA